MKTLSLLLSFFTFHSIYGQGITGGGTGTYPTPKSKSFDFLWASWATMLEDYTEKLKQMPQD